LTGEELQLLALKLFLVPASVCLISLAGRKWGPGVAGWIAGFPAVGGPILFILALENGAQFAAQAASASLSTVLASCLYGVVYAWTCLRHDWLVSLAAGLAAWFGASFVLAHLPALPWVSLAIALATLLIAPRLFPARAAPAADRPLPGYELILRMAAGAVLTLAVTVAASTIGTAWSGILGVFPMLSIVLSVFSRRAQGGASTVTLLYAMSLGMYSFTAFCFALALLLPRFGIALAFLAAFALATVVLAALRLPTLASAARLRNT
jgi:hypothetical protein